MYLQKDKLYITLLLLSIFVMTKCGKYPCLVEGYIYFTTHHVLFWKSAFPNKFRAQSKILDIFFTITLK